MSTIALFSHRLARPVEDLTGIGRYSVELAHALVARGAHDYVLVAPWDDEPSPGTWPDVPVVRVGGDRRLLHARWTLRAAPELDRLVAGIDLVHVLAPVVHVPAWVPTVVTIHDLFPLDRPEWLPRRGRLMFRRAIDRLAAGTGPVIVPSQHVAGEVERRLGVAGQRIHVVPEGVEDRFHAARPDPAVLDLHGLTQGAYVLALGAMTTRKNVVTVVRALATVPEADRPVLATAGPDGDATALVADEVRRLGLDRHVRRLGFVPDDDLPALVAGALALVHPATDEGFGLPVAESLAAGTPVLAADSGSLPEVVGGAGRLLPSTDVAAWAAAIRELGSLDRDAAAVAARTRASAWSWDAVAAATEEVHAAALAGTGQVRT